jgi:hypothetical protein
MSLRDHFPWNLLSTYYVHTHIHYAVVYSVRQRDRSISSLQSLLLQTVSRLVCVGVKHPDLYYRQTVTDLLMWGALSDEWTGLSFTIATDPRQRSHSRVRVPRVSLSYFTASHSRFPQPGGPDPRIYISQEQGDPVIPLGTGFSFCRLLRPTRLRWIYSNPPSRGVSNLRRIISRTAHARNYLPLFKYGRFWHDPLCVQHSQF